jgi:hypothetical protein
MRIELEPAAPVAEIELPIERPLPDYELEEIAQPTPRDVDPLLASQGFHDLLDEASAILERALGEVNLELVQLTGAICEEGGVYRPGLWLVLRERDAAGPMSEAARERVRQLAEHLRTTLGLS